MSNRLICYDAGHGGHDPGAVGTTSTGVRVQEKNVVLPVCLRAQEILAAHNIPVMQTRNTDVFVGLSERARMANSRKASLFLSVHCNAAANRSARGIETFIWTRTTIAEPWGKAVQDSMVSKFPHTPNRGLKRANFTVLANTHMPACLAELGFLSNVQECTELADPDNQERYALSLAVASLNMLGVELRRQQTVPEHIPEIPIPYEDEILEIAEAQEALAKRLRNLVKP